VANWEVRSDETLPLPGPFPRVADRERDSPVRLRAKASNCAARQMRRAPRARAVIQTLSARIAPKLPPDHSMGRNDVG